ncbi:hypothetical protein Ocin01_01007 [Orchesella cincta]|uniref:Uncharacterized protein n=1 Tax=Orchesella cincta TaxID=48709 RepID=A0A1D2NKA4_ORCCI|nr:hypothetical protein Ocin01_01007 [Orchesella cincta]
MPQRKFVDRTAENSSQENGSIISEPKEVVVHHVPFKVEFEGQANVDSKFTSNSVPAPSDSKVLINQFRGRPLQGQKFDLPKDYEGLVALDLKGTTHETDDGPSKDAEISLVNRFDTMTYWNWDRVPSGMDKHVKLLDWMELSNILHGPIED